MAWLVLRNENADDAQGILRVALDGDDNNLPVTWRTVWTTFFHPRGPLLGRDLSKIHTLILEVDGRLRLCHDDGVGTKAMYRLSALDMLVVRTISRTSETFIGSLLCLLKGVSSVLRVTRLALDLRTGVTGDIGYMDWAAGNWAARRSAIEHLYLAWSSQSGDRAGWRLLDLVGSMPKLRSFILNASGWATGSEVLDRLRGLRLRGVTVETVVDPRSPRAAPEWVARWTTSDPQPDRGWRAWVDAMPAEAPPPTKAVRRAITSVNTLPNDTFARMMEFLPSADRRRLALVNQQLAGVVQAVGGRQDHNDWATSLPDLVEAVRDYPRNPPPWLGITTLYLDEPQTEPDMKPFVEAALSRVFDTPGLTTLVVTFESQKDMDPDDKVPPELWKALARSDLTVLELDGVPTAEDIKNATDGIDSSKVQRLKLHFSSRLLPTRQELIDRDKAVWELLARRRWELVSLGWAVGEHLPNPVPHPLPYSIATMKVVISNHWRPSLAPLGEILRNVQVVHLTRAEDEVGKPVLGVPGPMRVNCEELHLHDPDRLTIDSGAWIREMCRWFSIYRPHLHLRRPAEVLVAVLGELSREQVVPKTLHWTVDSWTEDWASEVVQVYDATPEDSTLEVTLTRQIWSHGTFEDEEEPVALNNAALQTAVWDKIRQRRPNLAAGGRLSVDLHLGTPVFWL